MNINKKMFLYAMNFSCILLNSYSSIKYMDIEEDPANFFDLKEAQEVKKINNIFEQAEQKLFEYKKNIQADAVNLKESNPIFKAMSKEEFEEKIQDPNFCLLSCYVGGPNNSLPNDYVENLEEYMPIFFNYDYYKEPILSKKEQFCVRFYFYDQLLKKNNITIANFSMKRLNLIQYVKNNQINIIKENVEKKSIALGKLLLRNTFFTTMKNKIIINNNIEQQRKNNLQIFKEKNTLFKKLLQKRAKLQAKEKEAEINFVKKLSIKKKIKKNHSNDLNKKPIKQKKEKRPLMQSDRKTRGKKLVNYSELNNGK